MLRFPLYAVGLSLAFSLSLFSFPTGQVKAQDQPDAGSPTSGGPSGMRGSLVEDRAARQLIDAGDARMDASETEKALENWKSVIERYPRSRVR